MCCAELITPYNSVVLSASCRVNKNGGDVTLLIILRRGAYALAFTGIQNPRGCVARAHIMQRSLFILRLLCLKG